MALEIQINRKWFKGKQTIFYGIIGFLILMNIIMFVLYVNKGTVVEVIDTCNESTEYVALSDLEELVCPEMNCGVSKDDINSVWEKCEAKINDILDEQEEILTAEEVSCITEISSQVQGEHDDAILASNCYKEQIGSLPSDTPAERFAKTREIDIDKICGTSITGTIRVLLERTADGKTSSILDEYVDFTAEGSKVTCDKVHKCDFNSDPVSCS